MRVGRGFKVLADYAPMPPQRVNHKQKMVLSPKSLAFLALTSYLAALPIRAQSPIDNSALYHIPTGSPGFQQNHSTAAVTFDQHSLLLNGQRVMIYSGEYHPWRTPTGEVLWRDVLEKIKVCTQRSRKTQHRDALNGIPAHRLVASLLSVFTFIGDSVPVGGIVTQHLRICTVYLQLSQSSLVGRLIWKTTVQSPAFLTLPRG